MSALETPLSAYATQEGTQRDEGRAEAVPARSPRRSRWRILLVLAIAFAAFRLVSSITFAPMFESRLSRILGVDVDVGDVSFAPLDAIVTLRNVTVQAPEGATSERPAVVADRVRFDVQWLPLLQRSVFVREVRFEDAHIEVERLPGGGLSLERFLRGDPAGELPPGWTFALDRIAVHDSTVHLHGVRVGRRPVLDVDVRDAEVSTQPRRATAFGRAPNLRIDAKAEGGRIQVDGSSDLRHEGLLLDARIRAREVPVGLLRAYLPDLGWSGMTGRLSARLRYQRYPERRDQLSGRVLGRRIRVRVPTLDEPALSIRRAIADVERIDFRARRATLGSLTLQGAAIAARPDLRLPVPLFDGARAAAPASDPWRWAISRFEAPLSQVHVAGGEGPIALAVDVTGENIGPAAYWSPLRAWVHHGDGAAAFDGTARMAHGLVIEGRLTAGFVDVPTFARSVGLPWAEFIQTGRGGADVSVELAPGAADGSALDLHGRVSVAGLQIAGPDPTAFSLGADTVEVELAGILPREEEDAEGLRPIEVRVASATFGAPQVQLSRTLDGWILPPFVDEGAGVPEPPATGEETASDEVVPPVQLVVDRLRANGGRIAIADTAVAPPVAVDLGVGEGWASDFRLPGATLGDFVLAGTDRHLGPVRLGGTRSADARMVELSGDEVPVAAAAPFLARAGLPYRLEGGTASFLSRVTLAGDAWSADTTLTLRDPVVAGDTSGLERTLGRSLDAAFASLRDGNGDVTFQLAFASSTPENPQALAGAVGQSLRDAIDGAVPVRIAFAPGRAEPTEQGMRQIAALAETLDARPDLVVELAAAISTNDRRWLAEQALARELRPEGGFKGVLRTLGIRDGRERIRRALAARAKGEPGSLDADDEAALDGLLAGRPAVDEEALGALMAGRVARVTTVLADRYAIGQSRVVVARTAPEDSTAPPEVRGRIGVESRIARIATPLVGPPAPEPATLEIQ